MNGHVWVDCDPGHMLDVVQHTDSEVAELRDELRPVYQGAGEVTLACVGESVAVAAALEAWLDDGVDARVRAWLWAMERTLAAGRDVAVAVWSRTGRWRRGRLWRPGPPRT